MPCVSGAHSEVVPSNIKHLTLCTCGHMDMGMPGHSLILGVQQPVATTAASSARSTEGGADGFPPRRKVKRTGRASWKQKL